MISSDLDNWPHLVKPIPRNSLISSYIANHFDSFVIHVSFALHWCCSCAWCRSIHGKHFFYRGMFETNVTKFSRSFV